MTNWRARQRASRKRKKDLEFVRLLTHPAFPKATFSFIRATRPTKLEVKE